ncbi:hypothetical protein BURPS668_0945 [Burkholderia pseudomallei 668]|nr:hypothetical protein BURPS668_0945 [Burkholderia pseudomallei 668]
MPTRRIDGRHGSPPVELDAFARGRIAPSSGRGYVDARRRDIAPAAPW